MAHRGRKRRDGTREPNGRSSRAGRPGLETAYDGLSISHRLAALGAYDLAAITRQSQLNLNRIGHPRTPQLAARQRECVDNVSTGAAVAKNPNLSEMFPLGIAYEQSRKAEADLTAGLINKEEHDRLFLIGKAQFKAGRLYSRLHAAVWSGVRKDIEARLSAADLDHLLQTGRINAPAPPSSFLRKVLASTGTPSESDVLSEDEYLKRRLRIAERLGQGQSRLLRMGLTHGHSLRAIRRVEAILTKHEMPGFLGPVGNRSASDLADKVAFCDGLGLLAELYGFHEEKEKGVSPVERVSTAVSPEVVTDQPAAPPSRRRRARLPVQFSAELDADKRPCKEVIDLAIARLLPRPPPPATAV